MDGRATLTMEVSSMTTSWADTSSANATVRRRCSRFSLAVSALAPVGVLLVLLMTLLARDAAVVVIVGLPAVVGGRCGLGGFTVPPRAVCSRRRDCRVRDAVAVSVASLTRRGREGGVPSRPRRPFGAGQCMP